MKYIVFYVIDDFVKSTHNDTTISQPAVNKERIKFAHGWHICQRERSLFYIVHEFLPNAFTEITEHIVLNLMQLCSSSLMPMYRHTATLSLWR